MTQGNYRVPCAGGRGLARSASSVSARGTRGEGRRRVEESNERGDNKKGLEGRKRGRARRQRRNKGNKKVSEKGGQRGEKKAAGKGRRKKRPGRRRRRRAGGREQSKKRARPVNLDFGSPRRSDRLFSPSSSFFFTPPLRRGAKKRRRRSYRVINSRDLSKGPVPGVRAHLVSSE